MMTGQYSEHPIIISTVEAEFVLNLYDRVGLPQLNTAEYAFYDLLKSLVVANND